jgi:hypothetical protein
MEILHRSVARPRRAGPAHLLPPPHGAESESKGRQQHATSGGAGSTRRQQISTSSDIQESKLGFEAFTGFITADNRSGRGGLGNGRQRSGPLL